MKKNAPASKITFSSMNDDFVDARFDPEYKKVFQEKLDSFDRSRGQKSYHVPIQFIGDIDSESKNAIKNLVQEVIHHAEIHQLVLVASEPSVVFFSISTWHKKSGFSHQKKIPLPSAKICWKTGAPVIQVIIPETITSSEIVIKTIRLLCSKLFGKLFFDEHVPHKHIFKSLQFHQEKVSFLLEEKVHFCKLLDQFSKNADREFSAIGKSLGIHGAKAADFGKKEFIKTLISQKESCEQTRIQLLNATFEHNISEAIATPSKFFHTITTLFFRLAAQTTLILPHEEKSYQHLLHSEQWTVFDTLEEKLNLAINYFGEIVDCFEFLKEVSPQNPILYSTASLRQETLNELMLRLKKRGLVKIFLVEDAKLTKKQRNESNTFPLWIWRHRLIDEKGSFSPKEQIKKITSQYRHSIYQKLFEATFRLISAITQMKKNDRVSFSQVHDYQKIKSLISWLEFRKGTLVDMLLSCQVAGQVPNLAKKKDPKQNRLLNSFEQGWSYFISFALIHQYFLTIEKGKNKVGNRADRFFKLIGKHIIDRVRQVESFQIAYLLLELYGQYHFNLSELTRSITEESQAFDFFLRNQSALLHKPNSSAIEVIQNYSAHILQGRMKQEENRILKSERMPSTARQLLPPIKLF